MQEFGINRINRMCNELILSTVENLWSCEKLWPIVPF